MTQKLKSKKDEMNGLVIQNFVNAGWIDGRTLLHIAVSTDNMELVKQCFHFGINVNKVDSKGNSALHYCNSLEIAKFLVEHGIDVNTLNKYGETAVVDIYSERNVEVVKYLISIADLDIVDNNYSAFTLLEKMIVYEEEDFSLIKKVVNRTKDLNRINSDGNSYLTIAAQNTKYKDVILLLIKAGCDLYIRNQDGNNFYDLSFKYVQKAIQKKYSGFMRRKDMTEQQRQRLDKLKLLKSLELNDDDLN